MPTLPIVPDWVQSAVFAGSTHYTRRVDIYEADNSTLWLPSVPLVEGSLEVDQTRQERRSFEVTLFNENGALDKNPVSGLWYDKVIVPYMGVVNPDTGQRWEQRLGTFLPDRISSDDDSQLVSLTTRDFSKKMSYELPYSLTFAENTPVENVIAAVAAGVGLTLDYGGVATGAVVPEEISLEKGQSRWSSCYDLATAYGYDLYCNVLGDLVMEPFEDPHTAPAAIRFETGSRSNISEIGRQVEDARIRNHIVVTGEAADGSPIWGEALNWGDTSPTSIARLGYRTRVVESDWVQTFAQCEEYASRLLAVQSLESFEAELGLVTIPWLEAGVVAQFIDPKVATGDPLEYILSSFSIGMDLQPVSATLRRVTNVIERPTLYPLVSLYPSESTFP